MASRRIYQGQDGRDDPIAPWIGLASPSDVCHRLHQVETTAIEGYQYVQVLDIESGALQRIRRNR